MVALALVLTPIDPALVATRVTSGIHFTAAHTITSPTTDFARTHEPRNTNSDIVPLPPRTFRYVSDNY